MPQSKTSTILLVDDNADLLKAYRWILETNGYTVLTATGGEEALALLATGCCPDAIFIDFSMPQMDGAELVVRIREQNPHIPPMKIVILTSFSPHAPQLEYAILAGVQIAEKPNDIDALHPMVQRFVQLPA
jgi:CheY-like chemotaxis protein